MKRIISLFILLSWVAFALPNYIIIKKQTAKVYSEPLEDGEVIDTISSGKRLELLEYDDNWATVIYKNIDGINSQAYIKRKEVYVREIDMKKSEIKIEELNRFITEKLKEKKQIIATQTYTYDEKANDTKNIPDSEGERLSNGSIFYKEPTLKSKWVYLGDRTILAIEDLNHKGFVKVSTPDREGFLYIKKSKLLYTKNTGIMTAISKVIVVDRVNQNTQLYDVIDGKAVLNNFFQSTTGYNNNLNSYKTPKGNFLVSNLKPYMLYYGDPKKGEVNTVKKTGRAFFAVRFSGGYHLHGIPLMDELKDEKRVNIKKSVEGILGSHPSSHGCVRNSDENAKYIYDWVDFYELKKGYYVPKSPVVVIVVD